jgi:hypothetical protein
MNVKARSKAAALAGIAAALTLTAACGDGQPATPPAQGSQSANPQSLSIAFKTLDAPAKGDNKIEAVVRLPDGTPVTDANVSVTFRMPAMPTMNMPEMHTTTSLTNAGDGRYTGVGQLEMAGTWYVTVTVSRDGAQIGSTRSSVLAK